jgi:hypothetical protein
MKPLPKTERLISLSWAELAIRFRLAMLVGNAFLAAKMKQAIEAKKHYRKLRTRVAPTAVASVKPASTESVVAGS